MEMVERPSSLSAHISEEVYLQCLLAICDQSSHTASSTSGEFDWNSGNGGYLNLLMTYNGKSIKKISEKKRSTDCIFNM